jgi:MoaA/NifB/PqqE/SkfB family radical SAM enzyme
MTSSIDLHDVRMLEDLRFLWLEITGRCNLLCTHCYAESGPDVDLHGTMSYDDWVAVIDEAALLGCRNVQFIGGEPTLHPRLPDLLDHAKERGFEFIEVYTNATRIGAKLLECFKRNGVRVATSFYSDDPAVHERVTQSVGSWQRTVDGIERVLAAGLRLRVGVIETEQNSGHGLRATTFLQGLGVQNIGSDRQRSIGRADRDEQHCEGENYEELCGQCWKGKLCVTSSGTVFPCIFSRATPLGCVKSGVRAILQTAALADFRADVRAMQIGRRGADSTRQHGLSSEPLPTPYYAGSSGCSPAGCSPAGCSPAGCSPAGCSPGGCSPTGYTAAAYRDGSPSTNLSKREGGILVAGGELTFSDSGVSECK